MRSPPLPVIRTAALLLVALRVVGDARVLQLIAQGDRIRSIHR